MWIWWLISLVVLIACFIFAYKVIMSSYDFLPADKKNIFSFKKNTFSENGASSQRSEVIWDLKNQLKKVEETSSFYEIQFSKLQQRLKALEAQYESQQQKIASPVKEDEEDWKELYYEENEVKEKLENELDVTRQKLEEIETKLNSFSQEDSKWKSLQSDYDARLNDLQSMQNNIGLLQRQLEAAAAREAELEISLMAEIETKKQLANIQSENARLKSENDDLRRQIVEISKKEKEMEGGLSRLYELEKRVAMYEEEKAKMIADLELMVNQNKIFSTPKHSL
jgi:chromosome segregation ATPase